jgi:Stress responsive A/B Barrel Domain
MRSVTKETGMIRHIVVFSVEGARRTELDELIADLRALADEIDEIEAIACGRPLNATEFDAALTVDVADEAALTAYREHPAHEPVLERLRAIASTIVVADITA